MNGNLNILMNSYPEKKQTRSYVNIVKNAALTAIISTAIIFILLHGYFEFVKFSARAEKIESAYISSQKKLIKQEVNKVTDYIEVRRATIEQRVKQKIKTRVYEAHSIASNIYKEFNGKLPDKEVKKLIIEALRPLRFFNGSGYFYINSVNGVSKLHPLLPNIEGKNRIESRLSTGRYLVKDLRDLVRKSGEGFLSYNYRSFKDKNNEKPKIAYLKLFEPYDWYIATGDYLETIEKETQQELLAYIEQIRFGENSYIFVVDYDGVVLMNSSQKNLIGKNIWELEDPNGVKVIQEERKAVENPEGDFIYYVWNKPSTSMQSPKISFMKGIKDWRWMIGAGLYVDDAQIVIQNQKEDLKGQIIELTLYTILICFFLILIIIYAARKFSEKTNYELNLFLEFFKNISVKAEKINVESLRYTELRKLAVSANNMLDKQIEIETNRSKIEESLRASESRLNEAQRITNFGSWEYTAATDKLLWSDEVYRILELDPDKNEPNYGLFVKLIHPDDRELVDTAYKNSLKNKATFSLEHRLKLKSGRIKIVRDYAEAKYNDSGEVVSSAGTMQDITELREKDELIKRTQKMDALGKLTGGIAHDYNNMLGVILGYSELLLEDASISEKGDKYVTEIREAGLRAKSLTSKLMAFSRHSAVHFEIININDEILNHRHLLEKTLTARIKLSLDLMDDLWPVELDKGDLNDTVVNLAINASHAITGNGKVTITTKNEFLDEKEAISLNLKSGNFVSLSISDTGIGMDSETIAKIFDPFFTTKGDKGTGLGLSQVYGFVTRSGGNVSVESELNAGTEFKLYFPKSAKHTLVGDEIEVDKSIENGNETILVVDDEDSLCTMAKDILSSHGYRVFIATSATQALMLLKIEDVDLIFSDIIMPGMNGYELASEVTKLYPHILIQLASGYHDVINTNKGIDASAFNVLQKPYTSNDLLIRVRELLDKAKK